MATSSTPSSTVLHPTETVAAGPATALSWGAVLAGAVAALGVHILLTLLGVGIGVQIINPAQNDDLLASFSTTSGVVWSVSALIALWIGGWVAGRTMRALDRNVGWIHGFVVWSLATVVMALFLSTTAGLAVSGVARAAGSAAKAVAEPLGQAAGKAGSAVADQATEGSGQLLAGFVAEVVPAAGEGAAPDQIARAARSTREVTWALFNYFSQDAQNRSPESRERLLGALQAAGLPRDQAEQRMNEWTQFYDRTQQDLAQMAQRAQQEAKEAAEAASDVTTKAAVWTFIAFVIGAVAASLGGHAGAKTLRAVGSIPIEGASDTRRS